MGKNEIRPKYNRSLLENYAYYNHGPSANPIKQESPWAIDNFANTFDNTDTNTDRSRRKAKSVMRTIPNSYEDDKTIVGSGNSA